MCICVYICKHVCIHEGSSSAPKTISAKLFFVCVFLRGVYVYVRVYVQVCDYYPNEVMCVCVYIYIHTYTYTCVHYSKVCLCICVFMRECVSITRMRLCVYTYIHTYIHTYTYTCVHYSKVCFMYLCVYA